ncbi:tyrosine-type recombinase/integrase [Streptomyces venezuelae]|uniref:tyrosine-type recombinase/integrase n=1 Tax=Streptomyces venezuelae TaxID=54571 RepID=UPI0021E0CF8B|nr:tyrosine-type recombinase/integrase [Streptomyces venezuelae]
MTRLGFEHLRRHDLRRTGLTWFADAGVPLHVLRKIAGHDSLMTTQRYLHLDADQITAAGAALSARLMVLRAPRSLPVTAVVAVWPAPTILVRNWSPETILRPYRMLPIRPLTCVKASRDDRI